MCCPVRSKLSCRDSKKVSHSSPLVTTFFNDPDFFRLSLTVPPFHESQFLNSGAVDWKGKEYVKIFILGTI